MSSRLTPGRARDLVEARLSRSIQDALEAAVCLEAWGGVHARSALELAPAVVSAEASRRGRVAPPRPQKPACDRHGVVAEGVALVLAIVAVAMWATPLGAQLGAGLWSSALVIALPATFALQWALRSRYLVTEDGLSHLRADLVPCAGLLAALAAALACTGPAGAIAALLVVPWVCGPVLVRRGWGLGYGLALVAAAFALYAGAAAIAILWLVAVAALAAVVLALRGRPRADARSDVPFRRAAISAAIGCELGLLVVGDETIGWGVRGAFPALALVPSTVGGFWCGFHLWRLHDVITRSLRAVSFERIDEAGVSGEVRSVIGRALARLVLAAAVLSAAVVALAPRTSGASDPGLLVAFGCFAVVSALVGIAAGFGHPGWALAAVTAAVATEALLAAGTGVALPGQGLIAGSATGALLCLPPVVRLSLRPARSLATTVWIS